ncbi:hypothetical protein ACFQWF_23330 [Methylorubrum suomiense]
MPREAGGDTVAPRFARTEAEAEARRLHPGDVPVQGADTAEVADHPFAQTGSGSAGDVTSGGGEVLRETGMLRSVLQQASPFDVEEADVAPGCGGNGGGYRWLGHLAPDVGSIRRRIEG